MKGRPFSFVLPPLPPPIYRQLKEVMDTLGCSQWGAVCLAVTVLRELLAAGEGEKLKARLTAIRDTV